MLWQRVLIAVAGIPLIIYGIYIGDVALLTGVVIMAALGLSEYIKLGTNMGYHSMVLPMWVGVIIFPAVFQYNSKMIGPYSFLYFMFCCLYYIFTYGRYSPVELAFSLLGITYVVLGFSHLLLLRQMKEGFWLVIYVFLVVWSADTGAFFSGNLLGRHKLAPGISPNKTWEGFWGGLMLSVIAAYVFTKNTHLSNEVLLLAIAPVVSVSGQVGDLFESSLKRFAKVKDSGYLLPGHGGILDRFDSALWAAPMTYHLLVLLERL